MKRIIVTPKAYHESLSFDPKKLPNLEEAGHMSASTICAASDPVSFLFGERKQSTASMEYGNLLDCMLMTPELFDSTYIRLPKDAPQKPTKAMLEAKKPGAESLARQEWWNDFDKKAEGRIVISHEMATQAEIAKSMFMQHRLASEILGNSEKQVALEGLNPFGFPGRAKALIDLLPTSGRFKNAVVDSKTTNNVSENALRDTTWRFQYHVKMAWYGVCLEEAGLGPINEYILIWQRSKWPYDVKVREICPEDIELGREIIKTRLKAMTLMSHLDSASFTDEELKTIRLAPWQRESAPEESEPEE